VLTPCASTGAVAKFAVVVRDHDDGRAVVRIEYVAQPQRWGGET